MTNENTRIFIRLLANRLFGCSSFVFGNPTPDGIKEQLLFHLFPVFLFISTFLFSCGNNNSTPTQGKQKIYIDESYQPLIEAETDVFENLYRNSNIISYYKPEADVLNDFMNDSCRVIVIGRNINQREKEFFADKKSFPVSTKIAIDAMAFITHKENPVKELTHNELKDVFAGKITEWRYISSSIKEKNSHNTGIIIVFDNEKSCNVRMVKEKLSDGKPFPKNCFAVKTNQEVVDYVSKNKNALGIIGVNWISDTDDTLTRSFLSKVNVLGVSSEDNPGYFFQPYQPYIHSGEYPFCRNVYIINREGRTGLGTGFAAFVAGEKGQIIILKAGMVPATMPVRMVKIKTQ